MWFGCVPRRNMKSVCWTQSNIAATLHSLTNKCLCLSFFQIPPKESVVRLIPPMLSQGSLVNAQFSTWSGWDFLVQSVCELKWWSRDNTHFLLGRGRIRVPCKCLIHSNSEIPLCNHCKILYSAGEAVPSIGSDSALFFFPPIQASLLIRKM